MLQRQQNKRTIGLENRGRGIVPGALLKLLVKDKLLQRGNIVTIKSERMAAETPEERETRLQWMSTNQRERLAGEARREERGYSR